MSQEQNTNLLISMIFSAIAIVLIIFTDFGGFYYYPGVWIYVNILTNFSTGFLLIGITATLGYHIIVMNKAYSQKRALSRQEIKSAKNINMVGIIFFIAGLIVFLLETSETDEWWFDAAFYAILISLSLNYYLNSLFDK